MAGVNGLDTPWRLHAVIPRSAANGPGLRRVLWSQGCSLGCPGCFNPDTHPAMQPAVHPAVHPETYSGARPGPRSGTRTDAGAGTVLTVREAVEETLADARQIEGVTLTGGEPLEQPAAVAAYCAQLRARSGLSVLVLTGFARSEIESDPARAAAVADADVVIAGRYNSRLRLARGLRGSSNKEYWMRTRRYTPQDLAGVPELEIAVGDDGMVTITGMDAAGGVF